LRATLSHGAPRTRVNTARVRRQPVGLSEPLSNNKLTINELDAPQVLVLKSARGFLCRDHGHYLRDSFCSDPSTVTLLWLQT